MVGSSRAAQALQPHVMDEALSESVFSPFFNFSFTIVDSPYGDLYYRAIKKKTKVCEFNPRRLFVVCVDPFSLSMIKEMDEDGFREDKGVLHGLPFYSRPNFLYLIRYCKPRKWISDRNNMCLHDDGWLEVTVKMDSMALVKNKAAKFDTYRRYTATPSEKRIEGLKQTIQFFQTQGSVFLCRLPTCMEMNEIEKVFWPNFDYEMESVAAAFNCPFFSFVNDFDRYRTFDGNHVFKEDGILLSKALCDSILHSSVIENPMAVYSDTSSPRDSGLLFFGGRLFTKSLAHSIDSLMLLK